MSGSISYTPSTNDNLDAVDRRRLGWCLVIAGHKYRYYSGVSPGVADTDFQFGWLSTPPSNVVQVPTDVECIVDVGPIVSQMDDVKGVAAQEPVEVSLVAYNARTDAGILINPIEDLMRVAGHRSADRAVRLLETLTHVEALTDGHEIKVEKNVVTWPIPMAVHIGQEVIWVTGTDGTGTDVDPYRFTGCTRGCDQTIYSDATTQEHVVDDLKAEHPWVCSDVTTWRGRKAWIFTTAIREDGTEYGWTMYWSGFLDSNPETDGDTIKIRVAPLTAVMNYKLGVGSAARTATTIPGYHRFRIADGFGADARAAAHQIEARVQWGLSIPRMTVIAADSLSGTLTFSGVDAAFWDAFASDPDSLSSIQVSHSLDEDTAATYATPVSWSNPDMTFDSVIVAEIESTFIGDVTSRSVSVTGTVKERLHLNLVDPAEGPVSIVEWPDALVSAINQAQTWQPGPIDSWNDPTGQGGDDRIARLALVNDNGWYIKGRSRFNNLPFGGGTLTGKFRVVREHNTINCWAGWIVHQSLEDIRKAKLGTGQVLTTFPTEVEVTEENQNEWEIGGPAVWFYQPGEEYIGPFDHDVYTGGSPVMVVRGQGTEAHMRILGSYSDTLPNGATGYWFHVWNPSDARRREPCIQMYGDTNFTAEVKAGIHNSTPPQLILRLLASGIGNGDNGAFDTFPIGCNLPADLIDDDSFTSMETPDPLASQNYEAVRGKTIAEQTEGLLMACGSQVTAVYDPEASAYGTWKLRLVHMGLADSTSYKCDITDADLIVPSGSGIPVKTMVDGRTVRSYELKLNYPASGGPEDGGEKKDPDTVNVDTSAERNDAGGDHGEPLKIDLPGVKVEGEANMVQAAAEIVADLRTRVSIPRVRWIFSIRADFPGAIGLSLGDTVRVTSSYALGIIPSASPVRVPCRVVGMKKDLWENTLELEVRPYPGITAGWAPSASITGTPTAASVTVSAGFYSPNGSDVSWFNAGDKVTIFSPGDWANRTSHEILSTTLPNTITFTAAHGASAGDIIRTDDYGQATTDQKGFAFLADTDGELDPGDDPGYLIG